jgi:hypothetical protein
MSCLDEFFKLVGTLILIAVYPSLFILLILILNWGMVSWLILAASISPFYLAARHVLKKRDEHFLTQMGLTPEKRQQALEEWIKIGKRKKARTGL